MRAIVIALALATAAHASPAEDARAQWQAGRYADAVGIWKSLAKTNDPDALYNLGQAYRLGRGVDVDIKTALDYYRRADAAGHARAGEQLGLLLVADPQTRAEALQFLDRAALAGAPRAAYFMGLTLHEGRLVPRDETRAATYMQRAADAGIANAKELLATFGHEDPPQSQLPNISPPTQTGPAETALLTLLRPAVSALGIVATQTEATSQDLWAVDLGTFRTGAAAAVKWARISARKGLSQQEARFEPVSTGIRLAYGRFAEEQAVKSCEILRHDHIACKPFRAGL